MDSTFGTFFQSLRKANGMKRAELARRAGVSVRALSYWEADEYFPRIPELEATLTVLGATAGEKMQALSLLDARRGIQEARAVAGSVSEMVGGAWADGGDLLRALRLRAELTQEQVVARLGVSRTMLTRWETGERLPSPESLQRLCVVLDALPEERQALLSGHLSFEHKRFSTLEECEEATALPRRRYANNAVPA